MNKNDLRYLKTEANLHRAYLTLLAQQACQTITVKQICTLAQCSRNTFYLHYHDQMALRDAIIGKVKSDLLGAFNSPNTRLAEIDQTKIKEYVANIISSVTAQKATLTILFSKDDGSFQKQLEDVIYTQVLTGDRELSQAADTPVNYLNAAYLAAAVAGFIASWMRQADISDQTAEQTLLAIHQATINTNSAYLATAQR
ncbi:hypothetical protein [Lacticaseibacillus zhaodongensis]|uniref:hypothetical protein n=1 Tax=Lacticaseibacillus zhaodongensis TaxID=2668065 RepID=UPI0012D2F2C9|nr:hypothetical protein [Lacticaseibacillus zhaodongensis]